MLINIILALLFLFQIRFIEKIYTQIIREVNIISFIIFFLTKTVVQNTFTNIVQLYLRAFMVDASSKFHDLVRPFAAKNETSREFKSLCLIIFFFIFQKY